MTLSESAGRLWHALLPVYRTAILAVTGVFVLCVVGAALRDERHAMRGGGPGAASLRKLMEEVSTAPVNSRDDAIAALAKLDAARAFVPSDAEILALTNVDAAAQRADLEARLEGN